MNNPSVERVMNKQFNLEAAKKAYAEGMKLRREAVSRNASNRMRGLPQIAVPPKPEEPVFPFAYNEQGEYEGRLVNQDQIDDLPKGWKVEWYAEGKAK